MCTEYCRDCGIPIEQSQDKEEQKAYQDHLCIFCYEAVYVYRQELLDPNDITDNAREAFDIELEDMDVIDELRERGLL